MAAATLFPSSNSLFLLSFTPPPPTSANNISPFALHPRRPSGTLPRNPGRCLAAKSGPPLPPPESDQPQLTGIPHAEPVLIDFEMVRSWKF